MARSVKRPTVGFGSGHGLTVHEFESASDFALTAELLGILYLFSQNK